MLKKSSKAILMSCGTILLGSLTLTAAEAAKPQPAKAAPAKVQASFDAKTKTFKFGTKEMKFADNGTFQVTSSGRCIVRGSFFISTDFQGSQSNASVAKATPGAYKGGALYVESCKADAKTQSVTVEGKLPFHKKGAPVLLGSWKQIATLTKDGKVDITLEFFLPKGQSASRTQGYTLQFPTATQYTFGRPVKTATFPKNKTSINGGYFIGPVVRTTYANKADNCGWEFPEKSINYIFWHRPAENGLFFSPHNCKRSFFHVCFNPF